MALKQEVINRWALICLIVDKFSKLPAQCGETRIQKAVYLAKEMLGIDAPDFDFTIYRYGPYSEEISNDLYIMQNWGVASKTKESMGFSYAYKQDQDSVNEHVFDDCMKKHGEKIEFIATVFGDKTASELERLSTAYWVIKNATEGESLEQKAEKLNEVKPHVSIELAEKAISDAQKMIDDAHEQGLLPS